MVPLRVLLEGNGGEIWSTFASSLIICLALLAFHLSLKLIERRNANVPQAMDAGAYNYAIAFQERIKISDEKMDFYKVDISVRDGRRSSKNFACPSRIGLVHELRELVMANIAACTVRFPIFNRSACNNVIHADCISRSGSIDSTIMNFFLTAEVKCLWGIFSQLS